MAWILFFYGKWTLTARVKEKSTVKLGWLASWFFHGSSNGFFKIIYFNIFSFKKYFTYFNWRLITLQYCGAFCHTLTWISHGCTCIPHPETSATFLPIPSLRVVPVHRLWVPCFMHWACSSVFLLGKSHGWRSLTGSGLWGHKESDTTELTEQQQQSSC